jgi:hypothetical protein
MTRYGAGALPNACLDRVTEVTDKLKKLMKEFGKELSGLGDRVDDLKKHDIVGVLTKGASKSTTVC